ncbi:MAG: exosortase system-associated protein, TIGR04073 family [Candidatus Omnitrophica bacterium]|nr:exosortase system-associated protein, TIGR04073 family [Candidatus Omnitrophota bacterium]MDE2223637.1 exosortase system-associated protein, TIGR04073 family [Candidatus Omnitrophota bacterium]
MAFVRIALIFVLTGFLVSSNSLAAVRPIQKFGRGIANLVTAPVEIVKQERSSWIQGSAKTFHISAWLFCGAVYGVAMTVARAGSGVWDIVTFPFALPKDFKPLLKPDYVFQEWPRRQPGIIYKQLGDK